tara:strand:- start:290 stop:928 length:639 start_codon:yes stop_codon:yes gene_type:complete
VTDADLLLGRISPTLRLSSSVQGDPLVRELDVDTAYKTMNERVAAPLGVSVEEAAELVLSTVDEKMAGQIRQMALHNRADLSTFALFAYGGAGPLHAAGIATSLGMPRIIVPPNAGLFSAWGGLLTGTSKTHSVADILPRTSVNGHADSQSRSVVFSEGVSVECAVIDRLDLDEGASGVGSCVIEEPGATTVVPPDFDWRVGRDNMLILERR